MTYVTPGHPTKAGAGYDCCCGECLYRRGATEDPPVRSLEDLTGSGLLWLINRAVFNPWGLYLELRRDSDGNIAGWRLLADGEPFTYDETEDKGEFHAAMSTIVETRLRLMGANAIGAGEVFTLPVGHLGVDQP